MKVYDSFVSDWIFPLDEAYFESENFKKILSFYVIHTPVLSLSAQAKDLHTHGWSRPWNKKYYLNKQLKNTSTNPKLIYAAQTYADMSNALNKADLLENFPNKISTERIAVYNNMKTQFPSIFYHLRNSIAHARFIIRDIEIDGEIVKMYVFQDGIKENGQFKVSARMVLREQTLIRWAQIIEGGETEYVPPERKE